MEDDEIGWILKLPSNLPINSILIENKGDYAAQIRELNRKYIANNAKMQVNISYENRQIFNTQFQNLDSLKNEKELWSVFDCIIKNLSQNLVWNFNRFILNMYECDVNAKHDIISVMMKH